MSGNEEASAGGAQSEGRAVPWLLTRRVLLSPIQLGAVQLQRYQPRAFPSTVSPFDEYEDETHEEDCYTRSPARSADMDIYSPGGSGGDISTSSEVDDEMDFYELDSSHPPVTADAPQTLASTRMGNALGTTDRADGSNTPSGNTPVKVNTAKLHELRAKLLANRQATPVKSTSDPANNINHVAVKTELQSRPQKPALTPKSAATKNKADLQASTSKPNRTTAASMLSHSRSVDALLAEGHATANMSQSDINIQQKTAQKKQPNTTDSTSKPSAAKNTAPPKLAHLSTALNTLFNTAEQTIANSDKSSSTAKSPDIPSEQENKNNSLAKQKSNPASPVPEQILPNDKSLDTITNPHATKPKPLHPLSSGPLHKHNLSLTTKPTKETEDEYFKDVDLWLSITGFHDTAFREQKLKTHKMRAALEEKKRALEREFAELERQEAAAANDPSTKDYMRSVSAAYMPPPALPVQTSTDERSAPLTKASPVPSQPAPAGTKRPRSPSVPLNNNREKLTRLHTSGRAVRRDDLFDKPSSASTSRRGSDQRSHYTNDRPEYHQRAAFDASPTRQSISVHGQAFRPSDSPFGRRESWTPRSPEQWSARPHGWNPASFSDVNEQPIGQGGHSSNKCGYKPSDPRNRYNR
ncbi:unnamed protein product [Aureobasidium uvarum]|uniref:Uncharacterized protein n=1 Tax=Aureobasidium uvarum TaxID=2773716 RepID=A0A9N8PR43_9PEZI|nr:unnamed protein product [Aureobasidium uvarum]